MKKLILILLLACSWQAVAQVPTLYVENGDRVPNYYYWDSNWVDIYWNSPQYNLLSYPAMHCADYRITFARHFYTDSSLKVIGIAGIFQFNNSARIYDTCLAHREPDYMILYEATDSSFVALDSVCVDTARTRFQYCLPINDRNMYYDIREVYFTKPYTVYDSFYIACTSNNNFHYQHDNGDWYDYKYVPIEYLIVTNDVLSGSTPEDRPWESKPGYIKTRYKEIPTYGDSSYLEWRWYANTTHFGVFAIFDTTGMGLSGGTEWDSCSAVEGLRVLGVTHGSATLTWEMAQEHTAWEVAYGPSGTAPEECTVQQATTSFLTLPQLDTAQWYVAYIRADCGTAGYSAWSDSLRFYLPGDTTVSIAATTPQDRYTHLFPNPAQTHCTVFSSFHIEQVELYTLQGQRLLQQPVQSVSTELDIATLPRGHYLIAVHTAACTSTQMLVKN